MQFLRIDYYVCAGIREIKARNKHYLRSFVTLKSFTSMCGMLFIHAGANDFSWNYSPSAHA